MEQNQWEYIIEFSVKKGRRWTNLILLPYWSSQAPLNATLKKDILNAAVEYCCEDMRPMEMFAGSGFDRFIQRVLQAQATFNKSSKVLDASLILPHPSTISRNITDKYNVVINDVRDMIKKVYEDGSGMGITTDHWTDAVK